MVHKNDLMALKAKMHNDYHNLKSYIHEAIHNEADSSEVDVLYTELMESSFEYVSQLKAYIRQTQTFAERVEHRRKMRERKSATLYPYINRSTLKEQTYEN